MRGITEVIYVLSGLGNTPAATNRKTGVVYINVPKWELIKPEHKLYILLHELGHIYHDTSDEFLADQYAFEKYTQLGYSLTEAVYALSRVLTLTQDEHFERIEAQLVRALNYDSKVNHNDKAETILNQLDMSQELDNFNAKRFLRKVGKAAKKAAVILPPVAAVRGAKAVKKAVQKRKKNNRIAAAPATVRPTPKAVIKTPAKAFDDPLKVKQIEEPKRMPTPAPLEEPMQDNHWSEEVEEAPEETEVEDSQEEYTEEVEVLENDSTDEFLKKFGKALGKIGRKVGDAAAPFADMALQKLPGGNLIVAARKAVVANAQAKNNKPANTPAPTPAPTIMPQNPKKPAPKPESKKDNSKVLIIAAIVFVVILIVTYLVLSKKK